VGKLTPDFTYDELRDFLSQGTPTPEGFFTADEWARHWHVSRDTARIYLIKFKARDPERFQVGRQMTETLDGRKTPIPVYKIS
jgi:response regulator of citrate/malate metabolism